MQLFHNGFGKCVELWLVEEPSLNPFGKSVSQASRRGRGSSFHDIANRHLFHFPWLIWIVAITNEFNVLLDFWMIL